MRIDGRQNEEIRPLKITRNYIKYAEGSCLIEIGETKVICTASVEEKVPPFLVGSGNGWVTAEYAMLPRATQTRHGREGISSKLSGRSQEIQRLVGRSLRAVVDMPALGERTIYLDCDVIQADGGTRTASITGSMIALVDALRYLKDQFGWEKLPLKNFLAAISLGKVNGDLFLDLCYEEDSHADVDMNIVMTAEANLVEIQGTAEGEAYSQAELLQMLSLAQSGIDRLIRQQKECLDYSEGE